MTSNIGSCPRQAQTKRDQEHGDQHLDENRVTEQRQRGTSCGLDTPLSTDSIFEAVVVLMIVAVVVVSSICDYHPLCYFATTLPVAYNLDAHS